MSSYKRRGNPRASKRPANSGALRPEELLAAKKRKAYPVAAKLTRVYFGHQTGRLWLRRQI